MAADNRPAQRCVRVNRLRATVAQAQASLSADGIIARLAREAYAEAPADTPDALLLEGPALESSAAFREGFVTPQSRGSQLVAAIAAGAFEPGAGRARGRRRPLRGARWQDLAARPAAAGLALLAVDDEPRRVAALRANLDRLGADDVAVWERDVLALGETRPSGALRHRPARRALFRSGHACLATRPALAAAGRRCGSSRRPAGRLLAAAATLVAPGGALIYSVCTLTRTETLGVVDRFVAGSARDAAGGVIPGVVWALDDLGPAYPRYRHPGNGAYVQTLPSRDDTTGFFIARLRRVT